MYGKTKKERILFGVFLGLLGVALGGSVWAWTQEGHCGSCGGAARDLTGGRSLAPLGVGFYAGLLGLGVFFGRSRILFSGLLCAASAHAVILILVSHRGGFCGPCTMVGGAAILGGILSFFIDPDNLARGSLLMPIGGILTHAALFLFAAMPHPHLGGERGAGPGTERDVAPLARQAVKPGTASLLVFTRPGCPYCDLFEEKVLPELLREFGDRLGVERRPAPAGLPSPTLVISGAARTVFPGLPPISELRNAILQALRKVSYESESPLLSESR